LVYEVEPANNDWTSAFDYSTVAPVRIEGHIDASDVDYFVVELPVNAGPEWTLSVFDSCSVTQNTVNPVVVIYFEDTSIVPVTGASVLSRPALSNLLVYLASKYCAIDRHCGSEELS
jgi:hypothetical protein